MTQTASPPLIDAFGRRINYLRVSVTDRCDLRCLYCMSESPNFVPKSDVLSLEDLDRLCALFVRRGVRRLRITGGEPLMRRGVVDFLTGLSRHVRAGGLDEITLTTNATRLAMFAEAIAKAGVKRVNISLDTLDREVFARITRRDRLLQVLEGVAAARAAGLKVKINTVALKRDNANDLPDIIRWAHEHGMDIALIETMPLGEIDEDRTDQYLPLSDVRRDLSAIWTLHETSGPGCGPARYVRVRETGGRLGFITPMTHTFCARCNRVRLTCTGRLYLCLGHEDHADLHAPLRAGASDDDLSAVIDDALAHKPRAHDFVIGPQAGPARSRFMSTTGG